MELQDKSYSHFSDIDLKHERYKENFKTTRIVDGELDRARKKGSEVILVHEKGEGMITIEKFIRKRPELEELLSQERLQRHSLTYIIEKRSEIMTEGD